MRVKFYSFFKFLLKNKIFMSLFGLMILLIFNYTGIFLSKLIGLKIPGSLLGMILLALCMVLKIIPIKIMESVCSLILKNMVFFFVPLLVATYLYRNLIVEKGLPMFFAVLMSCALTLIATAYASDLVIKLKAKK